MPSTTGPDLKKCAANALVRQRVAQPCLPRTQRRFLPVLISVVRPSSAQVHGQEAAEYALKGRPSCLPPVPTPSHICCIPCAAVKLNGNRTVQGVLRGFDQFMNLVLDETVEVVRRAAPRPIRHFAPALATRRGGSPVRPATQVSTSEQNKVGMVVIRGNSVVMIEALEKLWGD
jgi:small nuclear ribonucleoprotein G